jgi:hypothetical protein
MKRNASKNGLGAQEKRYHYPTARTRAQQQNPAKIVGDLAVIRLIFAVIFLIWPAEGAAGG